jgi:hypothetical protein
VEDFVVSRYNNYWWVKACVGRDGDDDIVVVRQVFAWETGFVSIEFFSECSL